MAADHPTIRYQPALDGVRAVAVIAVLLFHAEVPGVSGGYLGVSVFFTLSGFLITSLLVTEADTTGRVAAGAFYARRARRLLPASILCLGAIVVAAATTDWFDGVAELRRHVIGALLQVANWVFLAGDGSYQELFEQASGAVSPVEHYWSLAIEEQFYWLWPLAFLGLLRVAPGRRARIAVLGGVTLAAAIAAPVIAVVWGGDAAYWATPARAAEILAGALLAVVVVGRPVATWWSRLALPAALALVAACMWFPEAGGPAYRGALPLVAAVSAALLLGLQADGPVRTALSIAPLVWLGRISYGVYLYHWPVFVVLDEQRAGVDGPALLALRLTVTLLVAQLSFWLVEQPIRHGRRVRLPVVLGTAGAATATVAVLAVVLVPAPSSDYWALTDGDVEAAAIEPSGGTLVPLVVAPTAPGTTVLTPSPTSPVPATDPPTSPEPSTSSTPTATSPTASSPATSSPAVAPSPTDGPVPTTEPPLPPLPRPVRIVVAGDSTAEATGVGLVRWAADRPDLAQVEIDAEPGCGFVRGGELLVEDWTPVDPRCDRWLDGGLIDTTASLQPDVVALMTTSWDVLDRRWSEGEALVPTDPAFRARIEADVAALTERLLASGAGDVVWIREPIPNVYWWGSGQAQEQPDRHAVLYAAMDAAAAHPRVHVVDLPAWLAATGLDTDQAARPDGVHWTPEASTRIAAEHLGERLVRAAIAT